MKMSPSNAKDATRTDIRQNNFSQFCHEKLFLGRDFKQYMQYAAKNPVNWVLFFILMIGIPFLLQRYFLGIHAVTQSSQDYPWGLLLGFGLFGMVPLSASGFLLSTAVEIFGRDDFKPIERLALLNGLLGYFFAVVYLLVDLGMPWRLHYAMFVSLGPAAVLFLVAWHVATYLSVQVAEMVPAFAEWIQWPTGKQFIKKIALGLTIAGIILSTLHQGALGALFCYAPAKIHPLWMSPEFQWLHYFCSSIFAGLCMVIMVSTLLKYFMAWRCDKRFLDNLDSITIKLGKGASLALATYLIIKIVALAHDNEWGYLISGWGLYYLLEMTIAVILPMWLLAYGARNHKVTMIRFAAVISVIGIIWNRLNTVLVCYNYQDYQEIPTFKELWLVITILAFYFITYRFILYRLPVLFQWKEK